MRHLALLTFICATGAFAQPAPRTLALTPSVSRVAPSALALAQAGEPSPSEGVPRTGLRFFLPATLGVVGFFAGAISTGLLGAWALSAGIPDGLNFALYGVGLMAGLGTGGGVALGGWLSGGRGSPWWTIGIGVGAGAVLSLVFGALSLATGGGIAYAMPILGLVGAAALVIAPVVAYDLTEDAAVRASTAALHEPQAPMITVARF